MKTQGETRWVRMIGGPLDGFMMEVPPSIERVAFSSLIKPRSALYARRSDGKENRFHFTGYELRVSPLLN
jgi:hypothetical protein